MNDAFRDDDDRGALVKSPAEFMVGTLRALDFGSLRYRLRLHGAVRRAVSHARRGPVPPGERPGGPGGTMWINSSTLLARNQFVEQLFRATEAAGHTMSGKGAPDSAPANPSVQRAMARLGQGGVRLGIDTWLTQYNTSLAAKPRFSAELQLQHAVLPLTPVDGIETGSTTSAYLEAVVNGPGLSAQMSQPKQAEIKPPSTTVQWHAPRQSNEVQDETTQLSLDGRSRRCDAVAAARV